MSVIHFILFFLFLCQFDVVDFLATRGVWIGSKMTQPIANVGLGPLGKKFATRKETGRREIRERDRRKRRERKRSERGE